MAIAAICDSELSPSVHNTAFLTFYEILKDFFLNFIRKLTKKRRNKSHTLFITPKLKKYIFLKSFPHSDCLYGLLTAHLFLVFFH